MTLRAVSSIGTSGGGIGLKSSGVLAQSAVPASVTGTLSETVLATIAIPAGAMGANGRLRVTTLWSYTNSVNVKTLVTRLGGTLVQSHGPTTTAGLYSQWEIFNRGALNSQVRINIQVPNTNNAAAPATNAIDMSVAQNLTFTGTLANTGETITLEAYTVEILNP